MREAALESQATRKFWTRPKLGVAAVLLVFGASNLDEVERWRHYNESGPMVLPPDGCQIESAPADNPPKQAVEGALASTTSAARGFRVGSVDLPKVIEQNQEYVWSRQRSFTMEQSGIEVAVHGPPDLLIDEDNFAELFHAPLQPELKQKYIHPEVRQLMACYRRDIIESRAYAGTVLHVFVAPGPEYCITGMRFQPSHKLDNCDAAGATLPELELSFAGLDLLSYNLMMLSTSQSGDMAGPDISQVLLHEAAHFYMSLSGQPLRLDPDEKLAKAITNTTKRNLYPNGVPAAISYP